MRPIRTFHISRKPVVSLAKHEQSRGLGNDFELARFRGPQRLIAIARDPRTIFAYWNVDWSTLFKDALPVDRQVHVRIHCADGLEEKEATVEPMAGMHYLTISQRHRACRIEIGYYLPADVWHSVATSNEIVIPSVEKSDAGDVDLAAIPLHLSFQKLVDLFGAATNDPLATVISRFQRSVASGKTEKLSWEQHNILRQTGVSVSQLADVRRAFDQVTGDTVWNRAEALLESAATSPSRGFKIDWSSSGS
jgi:hypothetical protein